MFKKNILNFTIQEIDSKPFVTFDMPSNTSGGIEAKSLSLQDFVKFCKNFEDTAAIDSGYIVPNLTRNIKNGSREEFLFFVPNVSANYTFTMSAADYTVYKDFLKAKTLFKARRIRSDEQGLLDRSGYIVEFCNPVIVKNIYYHLVYEKTGQHIYRENVLFSAESEGLLGKVVPKDTSKIVKSFFPNHFTDRVCWGNTGYGHAPIIENLDNGNINFLNTAISAYFNSNFNMDLFFSGIGDWTESTLSHDFVESFFTWCSDYFSDTLIETLKDSFDKRSSTYDLCDGRTSNMFLYMLILTSVAMDVNLRVKFLENIRTSELKTIYQLIGQPS